MNRGAFELLAAMLIFALTGCSDLTQPEDVELAKEMCTTPAVRGAPLAARPLHQRVVRQT